MHHTKIVNLCYILRKFYPKAMLNSTRAFQRVSKYGDLIGTNIAYKSCFRFIAEKSLVPINFAYC